MTGNNELMVTIRCITYNHEPYIRQCLEGFVMQKTNFRFEAIVHDDASTDRTATIIREYAEKYPDIIKPIFETENQYSKHDGSLRRIMDKHTHGKYVAYCEGDDYWIDPLKLQKQVDFLEANTEYGMVHTYFDYVNMCSEKMEPPTGFYKRMKERVFDGYIWDYYLVNPGFILTCTCCIRAILLNSNEKTFFDYGLFMMIARQSKVYCIKEVTASYRIGHASAIRTNADFFKLQERKVRIEQLYQFYCKKSYSLDFYRIDKISQKRIGEAYLRLLVDLILRRIPFNVKIFKIVLACPLLLVKLPYFAFVGIKNKIRAVE